MLISQTAIAGTVRFNLSWNDEVANQTKQFGTLSLIGAGNYSSNSLNIYVAEGTNITYSTSIIGLLGTPQYNLRIRLIKMN